MVEHPPLEPPRPELREQPVVPKKTAVLIVDMQNMECGRHLIDRARIDGTPESAKRKYFDRLDEEVIPGLRSLIDLARSHSIEVIYTVIESLTLDGRDRSRDYKISGLHAAKGSWEAKVIDELDAQPNDILLPKSSSSVFNSTIIDYVLRNLGIEYLIVGGIVGDQCVESTIRDAADRSYLVTLVTDGCACYSQQDHSAMLERMIGHYARGRTASEVIDELKSTRALSAQHEE